MGNAWFDETQKRKMSLWIIIVIIALAAFLVVEVMKGLKEYRFIGRSELSQNVITVFGEGEVLAVPDIATFTFSIREEALVVNVAQDKASEKSNQAIKFLEEQKINKEKDIKLISYNIYPRYEYKNSNKTTYPYVEGERVLVAYEVSEVFEVKVRKISDAGKVLSGIGEIGVSDVSGLVFSNDKDKELREEARMNAIADARVDAKNLARALGVSLVRIVNFSESGNYPGPFYYKGASLQAADGLGGGVTPEITPGENKIVSNVTVTYEIR